ncbi:transposase [Chitinophaga sp. Mgbs1]|uniref:Transposase n=2 Tax=Chitinophaga solisilvae TaxID=1233460 RepID=A0A9Q5D957_9BACT|nr:transposase [Chitinophaga solisilvae]NSL86097.1 transposase [Chitinophaga solisilvae]NSL87665.1 transposase [Chitinophaga solisilvae]NSL87764.1 transposase [Chitinophaga solisilvae]NSL88770.1 transposase [Chitinophaga solisilvae]
MDKRVKYSLKQKLSAVRSIISGKENAVSAARKLGSTDTSVYRWLNHYRQRGISGLKTPSGRYSGEFKLEVIRFMLKKRLSLMQTAILFGIAQDHTVGIWLRKYEDKGAAVLLKKQSALKESTMAKKPKKHRPVAERDAAKLAALEAELAYLRAENAFLKKLDALIQEEKAAQNKRPRPSGN